MTNKKGGKENNNENDDVVFEEEGETPQDSAKKLREKLKTCQKERQEYLDGWQRARADLQNAKREHQESLGKARSRAVEDVVRDLLPVLDSFSMAFENKAAWEETPEEWRDGMTHIYNQLWSTLKEHGVEEILPKEGDALDPVLHDGVETEETDEKEARGKIARVIQRGYKIEENVVRPARVVVFKSVERGA